MGEGTEKYAQAHGLEREHMDAMAAESHRRADAAQQNGLFDDEIVPVTVPQRRGDAVIVGHDEGVRGETTIESLAGLRPAFDKATATSPPATPARSATAPPPPSSPPPRSPNGSASPRSPRSSATARSPAPTRRCCTNRPARSRPPSTAPA